MRLHAKARHRAADHPGADGRRAGQRAGDRGLQRRRPRLAAVRDADAAAIARELAAIRGADRRGRSTSTSSATRRPPDAAREAAWRAALAPYYREFGDRHRRGSPPAPAACRSTPRAADVLEELRPRGRQLPFRPARRRAARARRASGARRSSSCATTVDEARWLEAHGVDAVIAQGLEAGGHRGNFLSDDLTRRAARSRCCRRSCARCACR